MLMNHLRIIKKAIVSEEMPHKIVYNLLLALVLTFFRKSNILTPIPVSKGGANMAKQKRIAAALIAAAMLLVLLGAALFLIEEAGHDCIGEGCPVCLQMSICRNTLKGFAPALCALVFAAAVRRALYDYISAWVDVIPSFTLVALKVKLSN